MIYEAKCRICGDVAEYVRPVSRYLETPECCGQSMQKVILSAPFNQVDIPAYVSPVSGRLINSRSSRRDDFKRTNCRPWEGMEQESKVAQSRARDEEKKADARLEGAIAQSLNQLAPEKRRVLETAY